MASEEGFQRRSLNGCYHLQNTIHPWSLDPLKLEKRRKKKKKKFYVCTQNSTNEAMEERSVWERKEFAWFFKKGNETWRRRRWKVTAAGKRWKASSEVLWINMLDNGLMELEIWSFIHLILKLIAWSWGTCLQVWLDWKQKSPVTFKERGPKGIVLTLTAHMLMGGKSIGLQKRLLGEWHREEFWWGALQGSRTGLFHLH